MIFTVGPDLGRKVVKNCVAHIAKVGLMKHFKLPLFLFRESILNVALIGPKVSTW